MAEGKKSFIFYCDWKETFDELPDAAAGKLIKHLCSYVNDENPKTEDVLTNATFANIKQALKRDLKKYENIVERNKNNGSKGGRPKNDKKPKKAKEPSGLSGNPEKPKKADSDSGNVSDTDSVMVIDNNTSSKEEGKQVYGREDINDVIDCLTAYLNGATLDGSKKDNRHYAKLLIDKIAKDYPDFNPVNEIRTLIDSAAKDDFLSKQMTSVKWIYYNTQKIVMNGRQKQKGTGVDWSKWGDDFIQKQNTESEQPSENS